MKSEIINYAFLGQIFHYYRRQFNYSRKDFVDIIFQNSRKKISEKTIQRIENGEYSRRINIYDCISHALGFSFIENETAIYEVNELVEKTCNIINSGKPITEYYKLLEVNKKYLSKYQKCLYLSVLLRINIATLNCYLNDKYLDEDIVNLLKDTAFYCKGELFDMAMYIMFSASKLQKCGLLYSGLQTYGSKIIDKKICILDKLSYYIESFNTSFDIYNYVNKQFNHFDQHNYYQLASYHNTMSLCKINLKDYSGAIEHTNCILDDKEKVKELLPKRFIYQMIKRKGTASFFARDYASCFDCLSLVAKDIPGSLGFNVIFLCKSAEYVEKVSEMLEMLTTFKTDRKNENDIHSYFINKYRNKAVLKDQEDMIIKKILPELLSAGSTIYIDIFHEELSEIVKESHNFDVLMKYEEMVREWY